MKFQWLLQGILDAAEVAGNWVASDTVRSGKGMPYNMIWNVISKQKWVRKEDS